MTRSQSLLAVAASVTLAACVKGAGADSAQEAATGAIDQANLCHVSSWEHEVVKNACTLGQKVVYLPERFGNAQLPILFAAVNCDLRYTVALTEGAVTCIYSPITPAVDEPASGDATQSD